MYSNKIIKKIENILEISVTRRLALHHISHKYITYIPLKYFEDYNLNNVNKNVKNDTTSQKATGATASYS